MSPVQARIFPLLPDLALLYDPDAPRATSKRKDLLVKAKTGTGKTMGFLIPASIKARIKAINAHLESTTVDNTAIKVAPQLRMKAIHQFAVERVGTLVVSPTRELTTQIAAEAANLTKKHGFQVRVLLGGESKSRQIREWTGRKDIVVCTAGRVLDLLDSVPKFSEPFKHTQMPVVSFFLHSFPSFV
jgi:ATP-dependent RNA helicase MSS116